MLDPYGIELLLYTLLTDNVDLLVVREVENSLEVGGGSVSRRKDLILRRSNRLVSLRLAAVEKESRRTTLTSMPILSNLPLLLARLFVALLVTKKICLPSLRKS